MTDTTFRSEAFFVPVPRSGVSRIWRLALGLPRFMAVLPAAAILSIPDSEVHAKLFKLGIILDSVNQRVLPSLFS